MRDVVRERVASGIQRAADASLRAVRRVLFPVGRTPRSPERILVHLVGNIGDIVVALPMLQALSARFPGARVRLLTSAGGAGNPGAADLLGGSDLVDEIHDYHVDESGTGDGRRRLVEASRAFDPDLVVLCPNSFTTWRQHVRNLVFARLVGPRFVVGSRLGTVWWALDSQVRVRRWFPHESHRYLALLDELDVGRERRPVDLGPLRGDASARIAEFTAAGPIIALCPGGKQVLHRWPADRFRAVVETLAGETHHTFVTVGGAAERELCRHVLDVVPGRGANAAGELDLRGTAELLRRADLLITNDTGPMHLAAMADVPVVALFGGAMPPGRWYPLSSRANVLRAEPACPECLNGAEGPHCVQRIPVDVALRACRHALADGRAVGATPRIRLLDPLGVVPPTCIEAHTTGWAEVDWPPVPDAPGTVVPPHPSHGSSARPAAEG